MYDWKEYDGVFHVFLKQFFNILKSMHYKHQGTVMYRGKQKIIFIFLGAFFSDTKCHKQGLM